MEYSSTIDIIASITHHPTSLPLVKRRTLSLPLTNIIILRIKHSPSDSSPFNSDLANTLLSLKTP